MIYFLKVVLLNSVRRKKATLWVAYIGCLSIAGSENSISTIHFALGEFALDKVFDSLP
jgi:hypothetical protein